MVSASCAAKAFSFTAYFAWMAFLKAWSSGLSGEAAAFAATELLGGGASAASVTAEAQTSTAITPNVPTIRVISGHLQNLLTRPPALARRGFPHLRAGQLRVTERQSMEALVDHVFRRGLPVLAKEES